MKPSAWLCTKNDCTSAELQENVGSGWTSEPLYSLSDIKAWLLEEPSAEVIHAAVERYDSNDGLMVAYCRGLFAAKLEELK
jgi:hypothetical protein